MNQVYIVKSSKFLPNEPVNNEDIEKFLGLINGKQSRAKNIVLRHNKIKTRYYALDTNCNPTHSNAELASEAVKLLFTDHLEDFEKVDLLTAATSTPDQLLPSHASMVHGECKLDVVEIASFAGSCCSGMQGLKYAMLSIKNGDKKNVVSVASERPSSWMLSRNFEDESLNLLKLAENPIIAFEKDFLRWMVSDGAAAFLISDKPSDNISLRIDWIDIFSFANQFGPCMYAGSEKDVNGKLIPWSDFEPSDWLKKSVFSLKQDVRLLNDNIVHTGIKKLKEVLLNRKVETSEIDYFLPHISSEYFREIIFKEMLMNDIDIPSEKWFTNLTKVGNVGSASIYLMIEELMNSDILVKGQKILLLIPESARFTYAYCQLTVV